MKRLPLLQLTFVSLHLILTIVVFIAAAPEDDHDQVEAGCNNDVLKIAEASVQQCKQHAFTRLMLDPDSFNICNYFGEVCTICTKPYRQFQCFNGDVFIEKVDNLLAIEIAKVTKIFGMGRYLKRCSIIRDYLNRNNKTSLVLPTSNCNETEVDKGVKAFHFCTYQVRSAAAVRMRRVPDKREFFMDVVCDMVAAIMNKCVKENLGPCHTEAELEVIKNSQEDYVRQEFYYMAIYYGFNIAQCDAFNDDGSDFSFFLDANATAAPGMDPAGGALSTPKMSILILLLVLQFHIFFS